VIKNWFDMKLALQSDLHYDIRVIWVCYLFMLVIGVVRIDLSQIVDLAWTQFACLFMCRCCLRWNVVDDGLKVGLRRNRDFGTKFREKLRSYRSWIMSCEMFGLRQ
jgi:hypothetical protein